MKHLLGLTVASAALTLSLAACFSTPDPSPRLLAAESSLQQAKANPATMEAGRASLAQAETAVAGARDFQSRGKEEAYIHSIRMVEGYLVLADTRGRQRIANSRIETLNTERAQIVSDAGRREVTAARAATPEAETRAERSDMAAERVRTDTIAADAARAAAQAQTNALRAELAGYEQAQTALGLTLILRDFQFASGSSGLTSGAQGQLAPLAAFLVKQPDARIQIAGHTDSQGAEAANQALSDRRAAAARTHLIAQGIAAGRITSIGRGESTPLSSNDTAAGRAINRRVEVTILD